MKIIHETQELVTKTRTGLTKHWKGRILRDGNKYYTQSVWWQTKANGASSAVQESTPSEVEPVNVGKKNELRADKRAPLVLDAEVKTLRDKKGYRYVGELIDEVLEVPRPMLAEKYLECSDKLQWPVFVQPKLDGHRALFDGNRFTTRGGQLHKPHIIQVLSFDTQGLTLDGELMLDPDAPVCDGLNKVERFQLSAKAVKKDYPQLTPWLRFYVYDCLTDAAFPERFDTLLRVLPNNGKVVPVLTVKARDEHDVERYYREFLAVGYEGIMVRDDSAGYEAGHRSTQLQKLKEFEDREFEIVDIVDGAGKDKGCAILVCKVDYATTFEARLMGLLERREEVFRNRRKYIGRLATVRFEGWTAKGKPRFPRALEIREGWDR